jgi:uncharacterized membrane protein
VGLISGIVVLSVEKHDHQIRFHAWQSVLTFAAAAAFSMLLPTVPVIGRWGFTQAVFRLCLICLYIVLIIKALQGERFKLPVVGDLAANLSAQ